MTLSRPISAFACYLWCRGGLESPGGRGGASACSAGWMEDKEAGEPRQGQSSGREGRMEGGQCFLGLADALHRLIVSFLSQGDVHRVAASCKSLGPVYHDGIRRLRLSHIHLLRSFGDPTPLSAESLVWYLERLPFLEHIDVPSDEAIELLVSAAAASSSHGGAPWLTTPRSLAVSDTIYIERVYDEKQALLRLLRLVGGGAWPRLRRLRITCSAGVAAPCSFQALVEALESRGDECDRLQTLEFATGWSAMSEVSRLEEEARLLGRLLASPCCDELDTLRVGSLPAPCFATLVSHLRSPRGRRVKSLAFHWRLEFSLLVPADPPLLIKALADGCLPALQTLEVPCLVPRGPVSPEAASALFRWAEGPFSRGLEVLKCPARTGMFEPLMAGVRAGHGLPVLRDIDISFDCDQATEGMVEELCLSMKAGAMPCLQSLHLHTVCIPGLVRLMESLSRDMSPCSATIQGLKVQCYSASYGADAEEGEAVGRALAAGACPNLTSLDLSCCRAVGDRTARSIADALRGGAARQLKTLNLNNTSLSDEGCLVLQKVMRARKTALVHVSFKQTSVTGARGCYGVMEIMSHMPGKVVDGEVRARYEEVRRQDPTIRLEDMFDKRAAATVSRAMQQHRGSLRRRWGML